MCESCDKWVRAHRDPFWKGNKIKTSIKTMRQVPITMPGGRLKKWIWTI